MWKTLTAAGLLIAGTALAADKATDKAAGVAIVKEWMGSNAAQEKPKQVVVEDQKGWEETWSAMEGNVMPKPETPKVDFDKNKVLAVFLGMRMSGGYGVKITNIEEKDKLIVTVKESSPPPGAMTTMALTSPYHVVVIPKSDKAVEFVIEKANKGGKK